VSLRRALGSTAMAMQSLRPQQAEAVEPDLGRL
jgi:hypothetical protein